MTHTATIEAVVLLTLIGASIALALYCTYLVWKDYNDHH